MSSKLDLLGPWQGAQVVCRLQLLYVFPHGITLHQQAVPLEVAPLRAHETWTNPSTIEGSVTHFLGPSAIARFPVFLCSGRGSGTSQGAACLPTG